jgi:excinuclease Cho
MRRVMKRVTRRVDFDATLGYEYPTHLRESIEDLPTTPGVYIFHGTAGDLPLYIGKSINIRARVMSHLRTTDEARMLKQTEKISYIRTTGEIGALLLEARLIKEQQPLFNQKLRRSRQICSFKIEGDKPEVVYSNQIDFSSTPDLYGLYASRHAAIEALKNIADEQQLCLSVLGLEKLSGDRPCFRAMLNRCAGACHGQETLAAHRARLLESLSQNRVICWPYPGAIGLIERLDDETQIHVVKNWFYLGSVATIEEARTLHQTAPGFDSDGYKILCKPIMNGSAQIIEL